MKARIDIAEFTTTECIEALKNPLIIIHILISLFWLVIGGGELRYLAAWFAFCIAGIGFFLTLYGNELERLIKAKK